MAKGPSKSTVIIQRLLEERRQYEAWIVRLNDSADATPGHVRARVRSDYEARLAAVTEELKAHAESARQAIEEKRYLRGELQKKEARAAEKLTETEPGGRARVHQVRHRGRHGCGAFTAARQRRPVPTGDPRGYSQSSERCARRQPRARAHRA